MAEAESARRLTTVELYGVPSILAGTRRVDVPGARLGEIALALGRACPALVGPVLDETDSWLRAGYTFVIDGRFTREPAHPIPSGGDRAILLVSSAAGG